MVAVSELVFGLDAELVRLGYKASTMAWYCIGAAGAACRGSSHPVGCRSFRWTWRWYGAGIY